MVHKLLVTLWLLVLLFCVVKPGHDTLAAIVFIGGPLAISVASYLANRRKFFPKLGMSVFGPVLVVYLAYLYGRQ